MSSQPEYCSSLYNSDTNDFSTLSTYQSTYLVQLGKLNDQLYRISRIPGAPVFPVRNTLYAPPKNNIINTDYQKLYTYDKYYLTKVFKRI